MFTINNLNSCSVTYESLKNLIKVSELNYQNKYKESALTIAFN